MNYKSTLFSWLLFSSTLSLAQKNEFKHFQEREATTADWFGLSSSEAYVYSVNQRDTVSVSSFEMSSFITWKQYKIFLEDVKRMLGNEPYSALLPKLPADHLSECLTTKTFDKLPVTGVSWTNAGEYCKWRMVVDNTEFDDNGLHISYRLPFLGEWLSANDQLEGKGKKHDLNRTYADWTLNSMDESMQFDFDYFYTAHANDHPSMKRKMVIGANFQYQFSDFRQYSQSFYQDSSYAHIGFRLVREIEEPFSYLEDLQPYLGDHYADLWKTEQEFASKKSIILDGISMNYYEDYGRLNGNYSSYYSNGKLKAKGLFYNNQRVGKWEVWDSLGVKQIERNYVSAYRFTQSYPKLKDKQANLLRDSRIIEFQRNEVGNISYPFVQERAVLWSQRYWSRIEPGENLQIFRNDQLINALIEGVKNENIKPYDTNSDEFRDSLSKEDFLKQNRGKVIAFELKSDVFYDLDRALMCTRPIGICPIVLDTIDGEVVEQKLAWFYFPHTRSVLSNIQCFTENDMILNSSSSRWKNAPGTSPQTIDDLFFFRDFKEIITGVSSAKGRTYFTPEESEREFFRQIETEHALWMWLESK